MKLAKAVEQVQCWLSEIVLSLQFCVENYQAYFTAYKQVNIAELEQVYIQTIDKNLEQAFKKLILADNELERIWQAYPVHNDIIELKNMVDNEHLYNRLKNELNCFKLHYHEDISIPYLKNLDQLSVTVLKSYKLTL